MPEQPDSSPPTNTGKKSIWIAVVMGGMLILALVSVVLYWYRSSRNTGAPKQADRTDLSPGVPDRTSKGGMQVLRPIGRIAIPSQVLAHPAPDEPTLLVLEADNSTKADPPRPLGPNSFDIMPSGFVISDPANDRVVFTDRNGKFLKSILVGFPPARVAFDRGSVRVQSAEAASGDDLTCSFEMARCQAGARLEETPSGGGLSQYDLSALMSNKSNITVEPLGVDADRGLFALIETLSSTGVTRRVIKYAFQGKSPVMIGETTEIPSQGEIAINDEFRISEGHVLQLTASPKSVIISEWGVK